MKLELHRLSLPLKNPFTISRGSITNQNSLVVELEHHGVQGFGEVTENSFYGHTLDSITASLKKIEKQLVRLEGESPLDLWTEFHQVLEGDMFALSALDMAAHDLHGKLNGIPTWQEWGLVWEQIPCSSFTIGIDSIDTMVHKLQDEPGWSIYKIKLGTKQDIEIVEELRKHTQATFRVDANCGWTVEEAIVNSAKLAKLGVEFIEQPLPITASQDEKRRVYRESTLPVLADEDCQVFEDVAACRGLYHGINVKLCKCGGLTPSLKMLRQARELGMKTMVGCMIESSIGISGAAQLLPMLDFADLDGAVLLSHDPASGIKVNKGKIEKPHLPGTGANLVR
jgi:L-Ala-D/L-Glu epimerase